MDAGRELDALVGQHIMGLNVVAHDWPCSYDPDGCGLQANMYDDDREREGSILGPVYVPYEHGWPPAPNGIRYPHDPSWDAEMLAYVEHEEARFVASVDVVPFYSTEPASLHKLLDKLVADGWKWTLEAGPPEYRYALVARGNRVVHYCGSSLAHSVCCAALQAYGFGHLLTR